MCSLDIQEIETAGESVTKKKDRKDKNGKKEGSDGEDQVGVCDVWMCDFLIVNIRIRELTYVKNYTKTCTV